MRVPWTARRSNQSILKEINLEYSLERLMLKLKLRYFGHLMQRADSLEKTLRLGKIEGQEKGTTEDEMVGWHHQLRGHEFGHRFSSKEQVSFNFMASVTIYSDFGAKENKVSHCSIISLSICHKVMGLDAMISIS